jgi:universal stress protein A
MQKRISEETHHALSELSTNAGYPITETLSGSGDLGQVLVDAIKNTIWTWWFAVTIRTSGAS